MGHHYYLVCCILLQGLVDLHHKAIIHCNVTKNTIHSLVKDIIISVYHLIYMLKETGWHINILFNVQVGSKLNGKIQISQKP